MFDVNEANQPTKCRGGCNKIIPPKTKKLRFFHGTGSTTISRSLCKECVIKIARELGLTLLPEREERTKHG